MNKIRKADIVKFHTPNFDEDSNQLYMVHEVMEDGDRTRAKIEALNTGLAIAPVAIVMTRDLEVEAFKNKIL